MGFIYILYTRHTKIKYSNLGENRKIIPAENYSIYFIRGKKEGKKKKKTRLKLMEIFGFNGKKVVRLPGHVSEACSGNPSGN